MAKILPLSRYPEIKNKQLVQKWASHGLAGYIMKPSTKTQILDTVEKALS